MYNASYTESRPNKGNHATHKRQHFRKSAIHCRNRFDFIYLQFPEIIAGRIIYFAQSNWMWRDGSWWRDTTTKPTPLHFTPPTTHHPLASAQVLFWAVYFYLRRNLLINFGCSSVSHQNINVNDSRRKIFYNIIVTIRRWTVKYCYYFSGARSSSKKPPWIWVRKWTSGRSACGELISSPWTCIK